MTRVKALDLQVGMRFRYRDLDVEVVGTQEPNQNYFGLPWFQYLVQLIGEPNKKGYAVFGPSAEVTLIEEERAA